MILVWASISSAGRGTFIGLAVAFTSLGLWRFGYHVGNGTHGGGATGPAAAARAAGLGVHPPAFQEESGHRSSAALARRRLLKVTIETVI